MARRGENIHKRKDGRWEGRYIKVKPEKQFGAMYMRTAMSMQNQH